MFNTLVELTNSSYKKDARIFLPLRLSCICVWSCGGSCGTVAAVNRAKNALGFLKLLLLVRLIGPPTNRVIYCENEEEERAEFSCVALFMWSFFFFLLLLVVPLRLSRIRNYMQSLFAQKQQETQQVVVGGPCSADSSFNRIPVRSVRSLMSVGFNKRNCLSLPVSSLLSVLEADRVKFIDQAIAHFDAHQIPIKYHLL